MKSLLNWLGMNEDYRSSDLPAGYSWRNADILSHPDVVEAKRMLDAYIDSLHVQSPFINNVIVDELAKRGKVYRDTFVRACRETVC